MGNGAMLLSNGNTNNRLRFEEVQGDAFFDGYDQEIFVCHAIIDKLRVCNGETVTVTFDKKFLDKLVHSHILVIRKMEA